MTDLDHLEIELGAARKKVTDLEAKVASVKSDRSIERAREALRRLGTENTLPVLEIIEQSLQSWSQSEPGRRRSVAPGGASEFIEQLVVAIDAHS